VKNIWFVYAEYICYNVKSKQISTYVSSDYCGVTIWAQHREIMQVKRCPPATFFWPRLQGSFSYPWPRCRLTPTVTPSIHILIIPLPPAYTATICACVFCMTYTRTTPQPCGARFPWMRCRPAALRQSLSVTAYAFPAETGAG